MVYESDFYTTRRPYSRPTITSYSVTATPISLGGYNPYNKKLVTHVVAVPVTRTPRGIIWGEMDRIYHRPRPRLSYQPKEDFLNDHSITHFDDETRSIRAQTNSLLRRINAPSQRPARPLPISLATSYNRPELSVAERISSSDDYILRMSEPTQNIPYNINVLSYYPGVEPVPTRHTIGRGHLACVTYAGGRAYPRRRERYSDNKCIKDEINIRSYYRGLDKPDLSAAPGKKEPEVETVESAS